MPRSGRLPVLVAVEAVLVAGVLAAAAGVASSRPAVGTEWVPATAVQPLRAGQAGDLVETVKISPNRPGRNFVTVDVYDTRRPSPGPVAAVTVTLRQAGGAPQTVRLGPQGDGGWLTATDVLTSSGPWELTAVVVRTGLPDTTARYDWFVADPSARLAGPIVSSAPLAPALDRLALLIAVGCVIAGIGRIVVRRRRSRGFDDAAAGYGSPAGMAGPPSELVHAGGPRDDGAGHRH